MSLSSMLRSLVSKTINDYGAEITLTRVSSTTYDAATSRATVVSTSDTVKAVLTRKSLAGRPDSLAMTGTLEVLVSAEAAATLHVGDQLQFNGSVFTCSSLTAQYFQGSLLYWTVVLQS